MSTDSDLSDKRLNANRKNAQNSTGPRTAAGKAASARNATTLGLFTGRDYVRPQERAEYHALGARYAAELRPEGVLEETLVTAIVSAAWRLRRCSTVEYGLAADSRIDPMQHGYNRDTQNSVDRARSQSSLLLRRSLLELRRVQTDRFLAQKLLAHEPDLPALASPKQIVTVINQHNRANSNNAGKDKDPATRPAAPAPPQSVALFCETESVRPFPHNDRAQTARNGQCPCGSGEKFKRCCLRGVQPARPYPHDDPRKPKNPGQIAPPVLGSQGSIKKSPVEKAA